MDKIYRRCVQVKSAIADSRPVRARCGICGLTSGSFKLYSDELQQNGNVSCFQLPDSFFREKVPCFFFFLASFYIANFYMLFIVSSLS